MTPTLNASTTSGSQKTKRTDIQLLTPGHNLCRLYGIIDLGEQHNPNYGKYVRKVNFLFEFPYLVQFFYEEDTERKPSGVSTRFTLSFHEKSSLRPFVNNMLGRIMSDKEAETFNIFSLADQYYIANIIHNPSKKNDGKIYENISTISKYDPRFLDSSKELLKYNDTILYSIDEHGFHGANWLALPFYIKKQIKESKQGQDHIASGGVFEERQYDENGNAQNNVQQAPQRQQQTQGQVQQPQQNVAQPQQQVQPQQAQPQQSVQTVAAPPVANNAGQQPQVRMLGNVPLQAFLDKNWTLQQLVDQGHAEYIAAAPNQQAPEVPSVNQPQASQPNGQPQAQQQPQQMNTNQPQAQHVMNNIQGDEEADDLPF